MLVDVLLILGLGVACAVWVVVQNAARSSRKADPDAPQWEPPFVGGGCRHEEDCTSATASCSSNCGLGKRGHAGSVSLKVLV